MKKTLPEERIYSTILALKQQIVLAKQEIKGVEFVETAYKQGTKPPGRQANWQPLTQGPFLRRQDCHYWLHFTFEVPTPPSGQKTYLRITTGLENTLACRNPQFILYLNGETATQALDTNHTGYLLTPGKNEAFVYFYSGCDPVTDADAVLMLRIFTEQQDLAAEQLYYDFKVPYDAYKEYAKSADPAQSQTHQSLLNILERATLLLDLRHPRSIEYYSSLSKAAAFLQTELYAKSWPAAQEIACIGHTHIDVAWFWTVAQTVEKAQRSFATVLALMQRYDDYKFMSSQPVLYQMVKQEDPALYQKIKARVAEGRWEVDGAMWLEPDTNLPSGESLVRQILYGKRFMQQEFNVNSETLWLPDVFGYSAALPQIMKKSGIKRFFTTKISWNDTNCFPHDSFMWQGLDGSEIFTAFSNAYVKPLDAYNLHYSARMYQEKRYSTLQISTFGYGDGGGGPTEEMLEEFKRLKQGLPGMPKITMRRAGETLAEMQRQFEKSSQELRQTPRWVGELYLEKHRGTYTSIAQNKRYNRKCEFLYHNVESAAVLSGALLGTAYPAEQLKGAWQTIMLNQFHDILPGSSIKAVYDVTEREYKSLLTQGQATLNEQLRAIAGSVKTNGGLFVYNPNSFSFSGFVPCENRQYYVQNVPANGYAVCTPQQPPADCCKAENNLLENSSLKVTFNPKMQITSIFDKTEQRELLASGSVGNVLTVYEDLPPELDAWEITPYYRQKSWVVDDLQSAEYFSTAEGCGVTVTWKYQSSVITQKIALQAGSPRLTFYTTANWQESHVLLKAGFALDILTNHADYEIQFGHLSRPNFGNTTWDAARFEVCGQKWADLSEADYGAALLNDCKYGYSCNGNFLELTLIKCATYPNEAADRGSHTFTYALYPHRHRSVLGGVVQQGYLLNNPPTAFKLPAQTGPLPERFSLLAANKENVVIEAVKKAEDRNTVIVRLYEAFGQKTTTTLTGNFNFKKAFICDLLENREQPVETQNGSFTLTLKPFEIVTVELE